jgi:glycosyltransferase involved in cell wall biosynthesis
MVTFSAYPADPRPRRTSDALLKEGMSIDLICLRDESQANREVQGGLTILRLPITHRRGGKLSYAYNYSAFIIIAASILATRSLRRRYDLIYVHNMPDILVLSGLVPKALGAKVILDLHDPMPELLMTIFSVTQTNLSVRLLTWLERWSIARANLVITVNVACKRLFTSRSCHPNKIGIVMNSPDEEIVPFRAARSWCCLDPDSAKPFVMMYHGSLVERNGLDLAINALAQLRKSIPGAELRIYGRKTPFLERVMGDCSSELIHFVHYHGPKRLEDLVREIELCDVGIIPNHRCAFAEINTPTRIFEYLALGKPVVAPRTPGIQDYFSHDSLVFFEPGNVDDLAHQIEYVFSNYNEALYTAERGQKIYLAHTWSQQRDTLVSLVSELFNTGQKQ